MTAPAPRATESSPRERGAFRLELVDGVVLGGSRVPTIAPPETGADATYVDAAHVDATHVDVAGVGAAGGVLVDLTSVPDGESAHPAYADAAANAHRAGAAVVVAEDGIGGPARPTTAVLRLRPGRASGTADLGETVRRSAADAVLVRADDLPTLLRAGRAGVPVLADVDTESTSALSAVAVACGADALWLSGRVTAGDVEQARETTTRLAPLVRQAVPDSVAGCREALDGVDAALATLLEHRVALAGRVQQLKPVGGYAGRDAGREAAIVQAMARRAPSLGTARLAGIMDAVIAAGLDVAEAADDGTPPVWRG